MPWPYRKNFCNQPHSRTAIFLIKGVIEFRAGKSVIFIIPTQSKWTEAYKKYVAPLVVTEGMNEARFDYCENEANRSYSILYLLQPDVWHSIQE